MMGFNQSYFNGNSKYPVEPILQFEDFLQKVNAASSRSGFFIDCRRSGMNWNTLLGVGLVQNHKSNTTTILPAARTTYRRYSTMIFLLRRPISTVTVHKVLAKEARALKLQKP